jgi:hypothetical protein
MADQFYISLKKNILSSATSSNDHALAGDRVALFLSDKTPTTFPFRSKHEVTEQDIIYAAKRRMEAELIALDISFGKDKEGRPQGTSSKATSGGSLGASS